MGYVRGAYAHLCAEHTLLCMRTTLDLDPHVYRAAKLRAAQDDTTLTRVVEAALRAYVAPEPRKPFKVKVITKRGRLMPGVDIDDRDALCRVMDER